MPRLPTLADLSRWRVMVAPMGGGPSTPDLVLAAAEADPRFTATAVTRAFSGRPARGLVNRFMLAHPDAPPAYPEINNATRPLRAAAAAQGDAGGMNLWAGQAFTAATDRAAGEIVEYLARPVG